MPQTIPAFAIPSPSNSSGLSLIRFMAIAPKIIANGPRIMPKNTIPTIPQTIDVIAKLLVFGFARAGDVGEPMAIEAVGLDMIMETGAWNGLAGDLLFRLIQYCVLGVRSIVNCDRRVAVAISPSIEA